MPSTQPGNKNEEKERTKLKGNARKGKEEEEKKIIIKNK